MTATEAWTIGRLLAWTADYLKKSGSQSPRLDAEVLLSHARGCQRIELYTCFNEEPSEQTRAAYREMVRRRAEGIPVAYLVGYKEFYSMTFEVHPSVLIPRPETEHVVVEALDCAKRLIKDRSGRTASDRAASTEPGFDGQLPETPQVVPLATEGECGLGGEGIDRPPELAPALSSRDGTPSGSRNSFPAPIDVADIGTGCGALGIALAKHLPDCRMTLVDIIPSALEIARRNAQRHGLDENRLRFVQGDLLAWATPNDQFDLIASNPPYVSPEEYAKLPRTIRDFEPRTALLSEPDGGSVISRLVAQASRHVRTGGYLIFEFSPMLESRLNELIGPPGAWSVPRITKDFAGLARVVTLQRMESLHS